MKTLEGNIKLVTFIAPIVTDEDAEATSTVIDTRQGSSDGAPSFDGALIRAHVGVFGADLTNIKIKIQESDSADGSNPTTALGGDEATITEAGEVAFQIERSKRYLLALVTQTASGAADTVPVAITGILHNWARPYPLV